MNETGDSSLLNGIIEHARQEAQALDASCTREVELLEHEYAEKARQERENEERLLRQQLEEVSKREESQLRSIERKRALMMGDRFKARLMEALVQRMEQLSSSQEYEKILVGWIAEAAVGIDRPEARVQCSFKEHITPEMLNQAKRLVETSTGKSVKLVFDEVPLTSQGVVVSSIDGKVSYDNRVVTRVERYGRAMNELMEG